MKTIKRWGYKLGSYVSQSYRPSGIILNYHHVGPIEVKQKGGPYLYTVTPEELQSTLRNLRNNFQLVSLDDFIQNKDDEFRITITFDDGYRSFLSEVVPVLEELGVPATVFVCPRFLESGDPPFQFLLYELLSSLDELTFRLSGSEYNYELSNSDRRMDAYLEIKRLTEHMNWDELSGFYTRLKEKADPENSPEDQFRNFMLNWENLAELGCHDKVTIGSHSFSHVHLNQLDSAALTHEIRESKAVLEERLDQPVNYFAYPFGQNNQRVRNVVEESGYLAALQTGDQPVFSKRKDGMYQLSRIDETAEDVREFWLDNTS